MSPNHITPRLHFLPLPETLAVPGLHPPHTSSLSGLTVCVCLCVETAIRLYQKMFCSAENCSEETHVTAFTVHVSATEHFRFVSRCCQGKDCGNTSDALGGCWLRGRCPGWALAVRVMPWVGAGRVGDALGGCWPCEWPSSVLPALALPFSPVLLTLGWTSQVQALQ